MEELVNLVSKKVGISKDMAKTAVTTVLGFLKDKLPAPIAAQIDGVLGGSTGPDLGVAKGLGGILGKR